MNNTNKLIPNIASKLPFWTLCIALMSFMLTHPMILTPAVKDSVHFCLNTLIPSLLPFITVSALLGATGFADLSALTFGRPIGKLLNLGGRAAAVFVLSLVSGPPSGAAFAASLYSSGHITKDEAERAAAISSALSPAYLSAGVGIGVFGDIRVGFALWTAQSLAAFVFGMILGRVCGKATSCLSDEPQQPPMPTFRAIPCSVTKSGQTMVSVCASVIFFTAVGTALDTLCAAIFSTDFPFLRPLIEITSGLANGCDAPPWFVGFACGFSGICMLMQSAGELSAVGLSCAKTVLCRLFCGAVCAVCAGICCWVL